jgi:hypothetical protein
MRNKGDEGCHDHRGQYQDIPAACPRPCRAAVARRTRTRSQVEPLHPARLGVIAAGCRHVPSRSARSGVGGRSVRRFSRMPTVRIKEKRGHARVAFDMHRLAPQRRCRRCCRVRSRPRCASCRVPKTTSPAAASLVCPRRCCAEAIAKHRPTAGRPIQRPDALRPVVHTQVGIKQRVYRVQGGSGEIADQRFGLETHHRHVLARTIA